MQIRIDLTSCQSASSAAGLTVRHLSGLFLCAAMLLVPLASMAAPGDADDDGIPDAVEAEIDIDDDGIADYAFLTEPFFTENFGTGEQTSSPYTNYLYQPGEEIQDGQYAVIAPGTRSEYWMTDYGNIIEDFTPGDVDGRAFGVNGAFEPGEFYRREMTGVVAGASYIFSAWIINTQPTGDILPNVRFAVVDSQGNELAHYESGDIAGRDWIQSTMVFESQDGSDVTLILSNNAPGGIGNDLLLDDIEFLVGYRDFDQDGTPDYLDTDSDNDGIGDDIEGLTDSDGDGQADSIDHDSDNDGTPDQDENADASDGTPTQEESSDTTAGTSTQDEISESRDSDADGVPDVIEIGASIDPDMDGDGLENYLDRDSDNDGLTDSIEAVTDGASVDENGLITEPLDSDGDGKFDMYDRDSDNDGLSDTVETQGLGSDADLDGVIENYRDTNGTGLDDSLELLPVTIPDTDLDGIADYRDTDSDNDGLGDTEEAGWGDFNGDGIIDTLDDADNDGLADSIPMSLDRGSEPVLPDADGNGVPDYRQGLAALTGGDPLTGAANGLDGTIDVGLDGRGCSIGSLRSISSGDRTARYDPLLAIMLLAALGTIKTRRESMRRKATV